MICLPILNIEVRHEGDLQPRVHVRVCVHRFGDRINQLDDELGHDIAWRRLAAEDEGARRHVEIRVLLEPPIEVHDVQHIKVLPLVLVYPLDLDVEQPARVQGAPHYEGDTAYRRFFSGKYENRLITGGIGHNLPQEAPQAFAQAIIDVAGV
jgi:pimeloyl-ACP methyl ester carboxylesterase